MSPWPVRTLPLPDECLSSWLTRSALALGTDISSLVGSLNRSWRPLKYDLDRRGLREHATLIAERSRLDRSALTEMTLLPIAERISGPSIGEKNRWPWILMLGIRGNSREFGTQFCPICLRTDTTPYFRRCWRQAWHVACTRHSTRLLDACPNCASQIEPHRMRQTNNHIAFCWHCNADFRSINPQNGCSRAPHIQLQLDRLLSDRNSVYRRSTIHDIFVYYSRLIASLRRSNSAPTAANPLLEYLGETGTKLRGLSIRPVSFEMLRTDDRYQLLKIAHDVRTIYRSMSTESRAENIPSYLRRALANVQPLQSRTQDHPVKKRTIVRGFYDSKSVVLPRPRYDVDRIWRLA
jgi:hypothetical protein